MDSDEDDNNTRFIKRRSTLADCDMHWISPSDAGTYEYLLSHISGDGGIKNLITAIADVSPPHVNSLTLYQATFAVVLFVGALVSTLTTMVNCMGKCGQLFCN